MGRTKFKATAGTPGVRVTEGKQLSLAAGRSKQKKMVIELKELTQALTKKDIRNWQIARQLAISIEYPNRLPLYDIYDDVELDLQVTGAIAQRKRSVMQKAFKLVDAKGNDNPELLTIFERPWFKDLIELALDTPYWGHTLIELGDVTDVEGVPGYTYAKLVPRRHVKPEFGVVVINPSDDQTTGYKYREDAAMNAWLIELGKDRDLGLFLKLALQTIPKKNMLAFWDLFGEIFGMPIRIGKTTSRDAKENSKIEKMLEEMGAAAWGLFPEGTEIEIKETTRGDAYNVYDKRIDKADGYISKGILTQTMTMDNGSSKSQSETHLELLKKVIAADADMLRDMINYQLLPRMAMHGFPVKGFRFDWDEQIEYTPEEQLNIEKMLLENFDIDNEYFIQKYNVPILGVRQKHPVIAAPAAPGKEDTKLGKDFFD